MSGWREKVGVLLPLSSTFSVRIPRYMIGYNFDAAALGDGGIGALSGRCAAISESTTDAPEMASRLFQLRHRRWRLG